MSGLVLMALAYGLLAVFAVAFVVRSARLARLPLHLRWELAPVPKDKDRARYGGSYLEEAEWWRQPRKESKLSELSYMLQEIVFLKALFEHNRRLWWFSFPFHFGLYLLAGVAGLVVFGGLASLVGVGGAVPGLVSGVTPVLAGAGYALGAVGALGLLVRRLTDPALRSFTTPVALFNLALLVAVFVTGAVAVLSVGDFAGRALALTGGLLTATPPTDLSGPMAAHVVLALVFLAYLPFGQMMHFVAKYFTYHQVRWDDRPLEAGGAIDREVEQLLQQPVTWAGPHVHA
ncbi:MAG: respiratory nitrate reductase subunit gamma, partial [Gemmatimonadota bacterium]